MTISDWTTWFRKQEVQQGRLSLTWAGEESFVSRVLDSSTGDDGSFQLIVDRLLPNLVVDPDTETVVLHGRLVYMDHGIEVITVFRALLGEQLEYAGFEAIRLLNVTDLGIESAEYVATLSIANAMRLSLFFDEEWTEVYPEKVTVSRIMFDAMLDIEIGHDGLAVPKAMLALRPGEPETLVEVQLFRRLRPGFEARISKIGNKTYLELCAIIEEIWRVDSGLAVPKKKEREKVGYRSREHDALEESFKPHILFLGNDPEWMARLENFGVVKCVEGCNSGEVVEKVLGMRCDLIVGDADLWGWEAVRAERALRRTSKTSDIPRIWIADQPLKEAEGEQNEPCPEGAGLGEEYWAAEPARDLVDYGAYDMLDRNRWDDRVRNRIAWAIGTDRLNGEPGSGDAKKAENSEVSKATEPVLALLTGNPRVKYRIGIKLLEQSIRIVQPTVFQGLVSYLEKMEVGKVIVDLSVSNTEIYQVLEPLLKWDRKRESGIGRANCGVMLLIRAAKQEQIMDWLKAGARDIVVLDASMRLAAKRITDFARGVTA